MNIIRIYKFIGALILILCSVSVVSALKHRDLSLIIGADDLGDIYRQIVYLFIFCATFLIFLNSSLRGRTRVQVPWPVVCLFGWALISLAWSPVPAIGFRRLALTSIIFFIVYICFSQIRTQEAITLIRRVLFTLCVASLIVAAVYPSLGVHQPDDPEPFVVGSVRGVFYHKNILGPVAAFGTLFSLHKVVQVISRGNGRLRISHITATTSFLICTTTLLASNSKTSIAICLFTTVLYFTLLRFRVGFGSPKFFLITGAIALAILSATIIIHHESTITSLDPDTLTGRGFIWTLLIDKFGHQPFIGIGYQSLFQLGEMSALAGATSNIFYDNLAHAHSSFMELYLTIGLIGLLLAIWSLVYSPIKAARDIYLKDRANGALLLCTITFIALHSFLESTLLDRDRFPWIMLIAVISLCKSYHSQRP